MRYLDFVFLLGCMSAVSSAVMAGQPDNQPASWHSKAAGLASSAKVQLPLIDRAALLNKYAKSDVSGKGGGKKILSKVGPLQFAEPYEGHYTLESSGQWDVQGEQAIWRLAFSGDQALGLNLGMRDVYLPRGARLYVYGEDRSELLGPYTSQNNKPHGELWTPVIEKNQVVLELNVPLALRDHARLTVVRISQSFRNLKSAMAGEKSGACNINVVCAQGDAWRDQARSVARYTSGGSLICSGTLLNNVYNDHTPYFLSADHCEITIASAPSLVFYWNYQTALCGDATGNPLSLPAPGNSGATFVAGWGGLGQYDTGSDFSLALMDDIPPVSANVYWSGWDATDTTYTGVTGIHHPQGHEKSISIDNGALTTTAFLDSVADSSQKFFRIGAWDEGVTEPGSSGSGLWNNSHRLIGTLSGGYAACNALTESDWYGRLAVHWDGFNNIPHTQLKNWLNPPGTPPITGIDGLNGCDYADVSIAAPKQVSPGTVVNFTAQISGGSPPYFYSWDLDRNGLEDINTTTASYTYVTSGRVEPLLIVRDSSPSSCPVRATATIEVLDSAERFVGGGVFPASYTPATGATAWVVDSKETGEGVFSLRSAPISNGQKSDMAITTRFSAGEVSFRHMVSSESGYDCLKFYVDGIQQGLWEGEEGWVTSGFTVTAGTHTLLWRYTKDTSSGVGADAAWIDDVRYTPGSGSVGIVIMPSNSDTGCSKNPTPNDGVLTRSVEEDASLSPPYPDSEGGGGGSDIFSIALLGIVGFWRNRRLLRSRSVQA